MVATTGVNSRFAPQGMLENESWASPINMLQLELSFPHEK
jgi:hypothetical protein